MRAAGPPGGEIRGELERVLRVADHEPGARRHQHVAAGQRVLRVAAVGLQVAAPLLGVGVAGLDQAVGAALHARQVLKDGGSPASFLVHQTTVGGLGGAPAQECFRCRALVTK